MGIEPNVLYNHAPGIELVVYVVLAVVVVDDAPV
jgi:hypothetical protein